MAPWGSLKNIFKDPPPEPPSPWTQLLPASPKTEISYDIFGEICHQAKPDPSPSSYPPPLAPTRLDKSSSWSGTTTPDIDENAFEIFGELCYKTAPEDVDGQAPGDQPPTRPGDDTENEGANRRRIILARSLSEARSRYGEGSFPPPLTTIARCGKPRVYFKSYRQDGRFVLREIRIPTQRLLHTRREDGRIRMQVVGPMETERRGGVRKDGD